MTCIGLSLFRYENCHVCTFAFTVLLGLGFLLKQTVVRIIQNITFPIRVVSTLKIKKSIQYQMTYGPAPIPTPGVEDLCSRTILSEAFKERAAEYISTVPELKKTRRTGENKSEQNNSTSPSRIFKIDEPPRWFYIQVMKTLFSFRGSIICFLEEHFFFFGGSLRYLKTRLEQVSHNCDVCMCQ